MFEGQCDENLAKEFYEKYNLEKTTIQCEGFNKPKRFLDRLRSFLGLSYKIEKEEEGVITNIKTMLKNPFDITWYQNFPREKITIRVYFKEEEVNKNG